MEFRINCTRDGLKRYPLHRHNYYEIMFYLEGEGYLKTKNRNYPFKKGTVIIVPPGVEHGSVSVDGFKNISIGGDFEGLLCFDNPVLIVDNEKGEGEILARLINNNKFSGSEYLSRLCTAYACFLIQNLKPKSGIEAAVNKIAAQITERFYDCDINLNVFLNNSGYAEDYVRSEFKRITGKTPNGFLTEARIKHACFLIDIYDDTLSLAQIAERCGYTDYIYFSKKFKEHIGMSPREYKKTEMTDYEL